MSATRGPIVVGLDGSEHALHALDTAVAMAKGLGLSLHVVHVNDVTPAKLLLPGDVKVDTRQLAEAQRQEVFAAAREHTEDSGVPIEYVGVEKSPAAAGLIEHCSEVGASMLVVGTVGRSGLGRVFMGSTAHNVINRAECDVLVVRPEA